MFGIEISQIVWMYPGWLVVGAIVCSRYVFRYAREVFDISLISTWTRGAIFLDQLRDIYGRASRWSMGRYSVVFLILVICTLILAHPQRTSQSRVVSKDGIDIMLLLDVSNSMLEEDFSPNRMTVAREVVQEFVSRSASDRVGVVVFAGKPFTSVPLTFDTDFVTEVVGEISPESIDQSRGGHPGTAMGDAMLAGLDLLEKGRESEASEVGKEVEDDREQVMILVTDGDPSQGTLDPMIAAQLASEQSIPVYTVGIGSPGGQIKTVTNIFGQTERYEVAGVNTELLTQIAKTTDANYTGAEDEASLRAVFDQLGSLQKTEIEVEESVLYHPLWKPLGWVLLVLLLVIYVGEWVIYVDGSTQQERRIRIYLLSGAVFLCIWGLIDPRWGTRATSGESQGLDVMMMLDVSKSMGVEDVASSRLDLAKQFLSAYVQQKPENRYGLGVFAGESVGVAPLTTDRELFLTFLGGVDFRNVTEQGTDLAQALKFGGERFDLTPSPSPSERGAFDVQEQVGRVLLIVSDGGEEEVEIERHVMESLQEQGVYVVTVGVGTKEGGPLLVGRDMLRRPVYKTDEFGRKIISAYSPRGLESIADAAGGEFVGVQEGRDVEKLIERLDRLEKRAIARSDEDARRIGRFFIGGMWLLVMCWLVYGLVARTRMGSGFGRLGDG